MYFLFKLANESTIMTMYMRDLVQADLERRIVQ